MFKRNMDLMKMEAQFNDLCKRMLQFNKPEEAPVEKPPEEEPPKLSRNERRAQERKEKKKERKEQVKNKNKNASKGTSLENLRTQVRISQFEETDKARIEKILYNK